MDLPFDCQLYQEVKLNLDMVSFNFKRLLDSTENIVSWFSHIKKIVELCDELYEMVADKLMFAGVVIRPKCDNKMNTESLQGKNEESETIGDSAIPSSLNSKDYKKFLDPFDKHELIYMADTAIAIKVFVILDVSLKIHMTQCTHPIYTKKLENLLTKIVGNKLESVKPIVDLKMFSLEYGLLDRSNYGGPDSKTEELIRLLDEAEMKLSKLEEPFLEPDIKPLDPKTLLTHLPPSEQENQLKEEDINPTLTFLDLLDIRKIASELILQQPVDTVDYRKENFPHQIKEISLRVVNLLSTIYFDADKNPSLLVFIAHYRLLLKKKFIETGLFTVPSTCSFDAISSHFLHDGTRDWLLKKIEEWLFSSNKPFCWLSGLEGTGKSGIVAAFCKLNQCYVTNLFVFDKRQNNGMVELMKSIANSLMRNISEYVCLMDDIIQENQLIDFGCNVKGSTNEWRRLYDFLLRKPLKVLFSNSTIERPKRRLIVIDGLNECKQSEYPDFLQFLQVFKKDLADWMCILITCRSDCLLLSPEMINQVEKQANPDIAPGTTFLDSTEVICLESKNFASQHIRDIETFFGACFCDIMSRKKFGSQSGTSPRYNPDHMALTTTVDKFIKHIAGKFSYAQLLLNIFEETMDEYKGQYQCSLIKTFERYRSVVGSEKLDEEMKNFAKLFNAYRQKDGTSVVLRINVHE
ncbi:hypothetical protein HELRODRAFT_161786 [Helobdella robusta]|uniref:Nephrocystin 3-like N-terminal domain-containing protein n=1 Tax=Helobdella robusta TaxID=6412 RepID=T1ERX0_HELRO|nr:hypothetical protein HELRODRAFT_161786 [Helobdella robusta]ESO02509.1 hypothetical protein HELRODRAFT_161786 [Helobdella robusta]